MINTKNYRSGSRAFWSKAFATPNSLPVNLSALAHLREARTEAPPHYLYLLSLAAWGLENGAEGDWPEKERHALKAQVDLMFGWTPEWAMNWLFSNPNAPDKSEQIASLHHLLRTSSDPKDAAAHVLNAIWSRQVSQNPALQPAASG